MRRAARVDTTQRAIVAAFQACGASVLSLAGIGKGCPDLLVARHDKAVLVECKTGFAELRPSQQAFLNTWRGYVEIIRDANEAVECFEDYLR